MRDDGPYRRKNWLNKLRLQPQKPSVEQLSRWIPDEYLQISKVLDCLGRKEITDWNGAELSARWLSLPPDKPRLWYNPKKIEKYFSFSENDEIYECSEAVAEAWWLQVEPTLTAEWQAEKGAFDRWFDCADLLRNRLSNKTYPAFVLEKNGEFFELPVNAWIGKHGSAMLISGTADFEMPGYYNSFRINGPVLLKNDFLTSSLNGPASKSPELTRFPYVRFLFEAASSNLFVGMERVEKKLIEHWLKQNWPKELGIPTQTKITTLATYLRRPEDEKGGLKSKGPEQ